MKNCPVCRRIYTDETYAFCLEDGALLYALPDSQATIEIPKPVNKPFSSSPSPPPTELMKSDLAPTQKFQPEPTQPDITRILLNHLKDERQKFSVIGRFRYNNEYIWTNGHFFEIAESLPPVLMDAFPLKEGTSPIELVKSLQKQLAGTYTAIRDVAFSEKGGMTDLISEKHTVHVNTIYYRYLHTRYPKAAVMLGDSPYNPALFASNGVLRAGIMGVKI